MKVFYNPFEVSCHGVFSEIGLSKELRREKIKDVPDFFMANPIGSVLSTWRGKGGWMISEFVNENMPLKKQSSESLYEFLYKHGLCHDDMTVKNKIGEYIIDLGGIGNISDEKNNLVQYGAGGEISQLLMGMRKGESVQDLITALKNRLKMKSDSFV